MIILIIVFLLTAFRQFLPIKIQIWQIFSLGALAAIVSRQITITQAFYSVDWNVIGFLVGMFALARAIEESHLLTNYLEKFFLRFHGKGIFFIFVFSMGILAAFFLNDTIAVIGTPAAFYLAKRKNLDAKFLLLGLCFSITIGSVFSPLGNPQNLLIAMEGEVSRPFLTFFIYLGIPSLINLGVVFLFLCLFCKKKTTEQKEHILKLGRRGYVRICKLSVVLLVLFIGYNIIVSIFDFGMPIPFLYIALIPALFLLIFAKERKAIFSGIDWYTIIFFIALFILMRSIWLHIPIEEVAEKIAWITNSKEGLLIGPALASQLISNVPVVIFLLPLIAKTNLFLMALAAGSTIAGNIFILGAASNVIVVQNAEKRGKSPFSFFTFAKYGIPLTVINIFVYWIYLLIAKSF